MPRPISLLVGLLLLLSATGGAQEAAAPPAQDPGVRPFSEWLEELLAEARGKGFSEVLLEQTLIGIEPLVRVIESDRSQAELRPGFDRYLNARLTARNTSRGKALLAENRALFDRIEAAYGVQRRFVVAIWGLESGFGRNTGTVPVFQALATLAWEPRRAAFFRGELFHALSMVDRGYIDAATMTGSWAGAMGQPQFMPSSYMQFAVDFDGDGRRDIWKSTPDALASVANYLKSAGWNDRQTWGREVRVSAALRKKIGETIPRRTSGCSAIRSMTERRPLAEWSALGVRLRGGGALPQADMDAGLVDVGSRQFLVYRNYDAILAYNCAHFYALSVALLGDSFR